MKLPRSFFAESCVTLAPKLLGCVLTCRSDGQVTSGKIVEVEAYQEDDPASHSARGKTPRNGSMFLAGGHVYVYQSYGIHLCLNVVAEGEHIGSAVLIRALEPISGIEIMKRRRITDDVMRLCRGPGCVAEALGITREFDGEDMCTSKKLYITGSTEQFSKSDITISGRIGITKAVDTPWRFYLEKSKFVSRRGGKRRED